MFPTMDPDEEMEADLLAEEFLGKSKPAPTTKEGIAQMEKRIPIVFRRIIQP